MFPRETAISNLQRAMLLERHLAEIEKAIPYLRRHLAELLHDPNRLHREQVDQLLLRIEARLRDISVETRG